MAEFVVTGPGSGFIGAGDYLTGPKKVIGVSTTLKHRMPQFIREQHPTFIAFLEAYYEWLELEGNAQYESRLLLHNQDIDSTVDAFISYFKKELLANVPTNLLSDPRYVAKHIKEFYQARGTEKSYRLLFRLLYNKEIEFYLPQIDILRVDDGKWAQYKSVRVKPLNNSNVFDLAGKKLVGLGSGASCYVERVNQIQEGIYTVYEIFFSNNTLSGNFIANETVESEGIQARTVNLVTKAQIVYPGSGYQVGEIITSTDSTGVGARLRIQAVTDTGAIKRIDLINPGANYSSPFPVISTALGAGGTITLVTGAQADYPGFYLNEDGHLDTIKRLQDDFFYQQFSYQILVDESLSFYRDAVLKLLHPAGTALFGSIRIIDYLLLRVKIALRGGSPGITTSIANFNWVQMLAPLIPVHATGRGRNEVDVDVLSFRSSVTYGIGPCLRSLERFKSTYLPSSIYPNENSLLPPPNTNYWLSFGNTQLKDVSGITLDDIINRPWLRLNLCVDPYYSVNVVSSQLLIDYLAILLTADFDANDDAYVYLTGGRIDALADVRSLRNNLSASSTARPYRSRKDNIENTLLYSEDFTNASWVQTNATITSDVLANPVTGTVTSDMFAETASNAEHSLRVDNLVFSAGQQYSFTVWVKANGTQYIRLQYDTGLKANAHVSFDLVNHAVVGAAGATGRIKQFEGLDWMQLELKVTAPIDYVGWAKILLGSSTSNFSFTGNPSNSVYLWGAQFRDVRSDDVYTITTGVPQYRSLNGKAVAKFIGSQQMTSTNTLDDVFNNNAHVVHVMFIPDHASQAKGIVIGDTASKWEIYVEGGYLKAACDDGAVKTVIGAVSSGVPYLIRVRHVSGTLYMSLNGGGEQTIACGNISSMTGTLVVGGRSSANYFLGSIARISTDEAQTGGEMSTIYSLYDLLYNF